MKKNDKLSHDIHFWLGHDSTLDEIGTAAYKTVELDDLLGSSAPQYREVQGMESQQFLTLFKSGIKILEGGVGTGFHHVKVEDYKPRLLQVHGQRPIIHEVSLTCDSLNASDAFILDNGLELYLWFGEHMNMNEMWFSTTHAEELHNTRKNSELFRLKQKNGEDKSDNFWKLLGGKKEIKKKEEANLMVQHGKREHELYRLSEKDGKIEFKEITKGRLTFDMFNSSQDCFVADVGDAVFTWIGKDTSNNEKKKAFSYAVEYLNIQKRPQWLPIIKINQGNENDHFFKHIHKNIKK